MKVLFLPQQKVEMPEGNDMIRKWEHNTDISKGAIGMRFLKYKFL